MGRSDIPPLRSLPRVFVPLLDRDEAVVDIPPEEFKKLHDVLRLRSGAQIAVLPGDGTVWRCVLDGRSAVRQSIEPLATEPRRRITLAQAMPRAEKLEEVVRMGTEIGVARFWVFDSDRTVVRWDPKKKAEKMKRLQSIAREAGEVAFRAMVPDVVAVESLGWVLQQPDPCFVLSEVESVEPTLTSRLAEVPTDEITLVIGPEGGWSPREVGLIGDRATTLGPRVLRVDTAAAAACAIALLNL